MNSPLISDPQPSELIHEHSLNAVCEAMGAGIPEAATDHDNRPTSNPTWNAERFGGRCETLIG
jgi:hypothetical protein